MIKRFENITPSEFKALKDSVAWVTILIAGADDHIETKELEWANKLTKIRTYSGPESLYEFYAEVGKDFEENVNSLIASLPKDTDQRNEVLNEKIATLNPILEKLDPHDAADFYKSLRSLAEHVAHASGGFLRFLSISSDEKKQIKLHTLRKFEAPPDEDIH